MLPVLNFHYVSCTFITFLCIHKVWFLVILYIYNRRHNFCMCVKRKKQMRNKLIIIITLMVIINYIKLSTPLKMYKWTNELGPSERYCSTLYYVYLFIFYFVYASYFINSSLKDLREFFRLTCILGLPLINKNYRRFPICVGVFLQGLMLLFWWPHFELERKYLEMDKSSLFLRRRKHFPKLVNSC